jgi:hypothetical protein
MEIWDIAIDGWVATPDVLSRSSMPAYISGATHILRRDWIDVESGRKDQEKEGFMKDSLVSMFKCFKGQVGAQGDEVMGYLISLPILFRDIVLDHVS